MKIVKLETFIVRIAYKHVETSSLINRGGVSDVIVKLTTQDGMVGWGECTRAADTAGIESAVQAMAPLVVGRSIWDNEAIQRDLAIHAVWAFQPMTGNFAYAGIDMALLGPLRQGVRSNRSTACLAAPCAMRSIISTTWNGARPTSIAAQAKEGVQPRLSGLLHQGRGRRAARGGDAGGAARHDRTGRQDPHRRQPGLDDPEAARLLKRWHHRFDIDFVEAPVRIDPVENMLDLRRLVDVPFCVNEGLWREADAYRIIKSRCGDYLCFSQYWVGSLARWHLFNHAEPPRGLAGREAHPWRARADRGGRPARHAGGTQCCRRAASRLRR